MRALLYIILAFAFVTIAAASEDARLFPRVGIFINNHLAGKTNGCTGGLGLKGRITCGHVGKVSEVSWQYLRSTKQGDVYRFVRVFPLGEKSATKQVEEVTYSGEQVQVWKDSVQRILIQPSKNQVEKVAAPNP